MNIILKNEKTKDKLKFNSLDLLQVLNVSYNEDDLCGYIEPNVIIEKQNELREAFGCIANNILTMAEDAKKYECRLTFF